jgi:hypothetical protein
MTEVTWTSTSSTLATSSPASSAAACSTSPSSAPRASAAQPIPPLPEIPTWERIDHDLYLNGERAYQSALKIVYDTCRNLLARITEIEAALAARMPPPLTLDSPMPTLIYNLGPAAPASRIIPLPVVADPTHDDAAPDNDIAAEMTMCDAYAAKRGIMSS